MSKALGKTLRKLRIDEGLTLREVATLVHITPAYLCDIENDNRTPAESVIEDLSRIYKIDKSELMAAAGRLTEHAQQWLKSTPEVIKLIETMYRQNFDESAVRHIRRSILP